MPERPGTLADFREPIVLAGLICAALVVSGMAPFDRFTWWLEVAPVLIALPLLALTAKRFRLTPLLYRLIWLHMLILIVGGHYTYARVPLGEWVRDWLDISRNHYDRMAHFAQGFIPAIFVRELILRNLGRLTRFWRCVFIVSVCLAFSAFYEMLEWWAAVVGGDSAESFLGTQGDVWDTQWDMFLAMVGAICALITLSGHHDRQLSSLEDL
ncbi:MAG: DUF2238 domain-containing protein [Acidobacteria bacterium]|nr:DUF2238 domain-containing protein [Acidobacteriota bacterium]